MCPAAEGGKNSTETENFRLALSDLRCSASRAGHCLGQGETEKMHPGSGQRRERAVQGFSPSGENPWRRDSFAALGIERAKGGGRLQRLEPKITGSCESSCLLLWQRLLDSDRRPPACERTSGTFSNDFGSFLTVFAPFHILFDPLCPRCFRVVRGGVWYALWSEPFPALAGVFYRQGRGAFFMPLTV